MTILPFVIDARPTYLHSDGVPRSLLLIPVGTQTLLERMFEQIQAVTDEAATILTTFAPDPNYEECLCKAGSSVSRAASITGVDDILDCLEPSDWFLMLDSRWFPTEEVDLHELLPQPARSQGARHLVAMEPGQQGTKEYVQLDASGRVRRIQRYYDGVTWLRTRAVAASLIPASAVRQAPIGAFRDLATLRKSLVAEGVASSDIGLPGGVFDLNQEHGLLQLCERSLRDLAERTPPPDFQATAPGVWLGARCWIHPTARLYGPVILHDGVRVEADATLVGPLLVGAGSRICHEAVVAQCLVASGVDVEKQTTSRCCVLCGAAGDDPLLTAEPPVESRDDPGLEALCVTSQTDSASWRDWEWRQKTLIAMKRVGDGIVAFLGLIVLSPLILFTAAGIKLTSRGPVFFYHEREGKNGRPFRCCKFRTMVASAHRQQRSLYEQNALDGPQFKLDHDPRITWLGHWVRVSNLDELPQLFNVVLGQMSLIGPRPSPFRENQICVPWREARLAVRPGITGLWQICRQDRSGGDFHQWIHYDMLYVRHLSFWLDAKILLATLLTLGGRWSVPVTWLIPARRLCEEYEGVQATPAIRA